MDGVNAADLGGTIDVSSTLEDAMALLMREDKSMVGVTEKARSSSAYSLPNGVHRMLRAQRERPRPTLEESPALERRDRQARLSRFCFCLAAVFCSRLLVPGHQVDDGVAATGLQHCKALLEGLRPVPGLDERLGLGHAASSRRGGPGLRWWATSALELALREVRLAPAARSSPW